MRRTIGNAMALVMILGLAGGPLAGCREEGNAEKAGRALDEAVDEAKEELEDMKEKMSE